MAVAIAPGAPVWPLPRRPATLSGVILVADNRDSFIWSVVQALQVAGAEVALRRAEELDPARVRALAPDGLLIGPGPGGPDDARAALELVRGLSGELPILGVCLGHQVLARAFGARVARAPEPLHGFASEVRHDGRGLFEGLPSPLAVGRYHSLEVVESTLPDELEVSARGPRGEVQALRHRELALDGVQFDPESVLSRGADRLLARFAERCARAAGRAPGSSAATDRSTDGAPPRRGCAAGAE